MSGCSRSVGEGYGGSCLCGAVAFQVDGFAAHIAHCHCSMCRKFHGAAFATIASVEGFRWTHGEELLASYTAENGTTRTFCSICGSSLTFSSPRAPSDAVEVALGAFDGELPVVPDAHIFVRYRANWTMLDDKLPQFAEGRDSEPME